MGQRGGSVLDFVLIFRSFVPVSFSLFFFHIFLFCLSFSPSFLLFYVFGGVGDSMVVVLIMMYLIVRLFFLYSLFYFIFCFSKGRRRKKWVHVKECPQL